MGVTRLGRRWNLDPKTQISIGDYSCFRNNPIFFIDRHGDTYDPSNDSKAKADDLRSEAKSSKSSAESYLKSLSIQLNKETKKYDRKPTLKRENNIKYYKTKIQETKQDIFQYESTICELDEMGASPIIYRFEEARQNENRTIFQDGKVVMFCMNRNDMIGHEAKHGYQYLIGEISFNNVGDIDWLYDINDEMASYYRQHAFEKNLKTFSTDPNRVEYYSGYTQNFVRSLNKMYLKLPNEALTNSTTLGQLIQAIGPQNTMLLNYTRNMSQKSKDNKLNKPIKDLDIGSHIQNFQK